MKELVSTLSESVTGSAADVSDLGGDHRMHRLPEERPLRQQCCLQLEKKKIKSGSRLQI